METNNFNIRNSALKEGKCVYGYFFAFITMLKFEKIYLLYVGNICLLHVYMSEYICFERNRSRWSYCFQ